MQPDAQPLKQPWEPPRMAVLDRTDKTESGTLSILTESVRTTTVGDLTFHGSAS